LFLQTMRASMAPIPLQEPPSLASPPPPLPLQAGRNAKSAMIPAVANLNINVFMGELISRVFDKGKRKTKKIIK